MSAPSDMSEKTKRGKMKKSIKSSIHEIKEKSKAFLDNRKCANNLIDLIAYAQAEEVEVVLACIRALHRVFHHLLVQGEMYLDKPWHTEEDKKDLSKEERYRVWLRERYVDCWSQLQEMLVHQNSSVREMALATLMKFTEDEGNTPLTKVRRQQQHFFHVSGFQGIIKSLLSSVEDTADLIVRFQEYLEYDDIRYFTMKAVLKIQKESGSRDQQPTDTYLNNLFTLLENLSMPKCPEDGTMTKFLCKQPEYETPPPVTIYKQHKRLFTSTWLLFLKNKLTNNLYKVLAILHEKVMPFMSNPLLLSDFLTSSYNIGGAISLLALNGLFVLVHSFNLDYPDFYQKVYALLEPSIFHVKYRARFFYLLDLFLSSTHLPAYLAAAFSKKLSRLALTAPPSGLTVIVPFVCNLIRRHPSCQVQLHKPDGPTDITEDPFQMEEPDPAKSKALQSSLWELKILEDHYQHSISTEAKKISLPLTSQEKEISRLLETTTQDIFEGEVKKKARVVPTNFDCPKGLFAQKDDTFRELWLLE